MAGSVPEVVDVGSADEVLRAGRAVVTIDGVQVLIIKSRRKVYALINTCPHLQVPLENAAVRRSALICAGHGYRWDLRSGRPVGAVRRAQFRMAGLAMLSVAIEDGHLYVQRPRSLV